MMYSVIERNKQKFDWFLILEIFIFRIIMIIKFKIIQSYLISKYTIFFTYVYFSKFEIEVTKLDFMGLT